MYSFKNTFSDFEKLNKVSYKKVKKKELYDLNK
jgi:hypothetical protein